MSALRALRVRFEYSDYRMFVTSVHLGPTHDDTAIDYVQYLPHLRGPHWEKCQITEAGLRKALQLENLRTLYVSGLNLSDDEFDESEDLQQVKKGFLASAPRRYRQYREFHRRARRDSRLQSRPPVVSGAGVLHRCEV